MLNHLLKEPQKPSRVVIIGASGFVGSTIGAELRRDGVDVVPLTRKELDLLADGAAKKLTALLRPTDSVVMISAVAPAKNSAQLMTNLRMAEQVCDGLTAAEIAHLLYISSDAVYADDANPVTEASPVAPSTIHGMMHAARELMLRSSTKAPFAALRPTLIYGKADPHNGYGPNRFRRQAQKGEPVSIFGEGEERRDHILVNDVARLASRILHRRSHGALNAVTGIATSFHDIAHIVASHFPGARVVSQPRPGPRPHLMHRHFDITNALTAFPDFHCVPPSEGLALADKS
ncbi:MAG: NAD-dependent epimerase/dehydratase family protein [Alphaproteobacteria bacterium]|nr:NAD-dependent epimerase/dehydratase family protein [Alphaproteobacteria bacterium]